MLSLTFPIYHSLSIGFEIMKIILVSFATLLLSCTGIPDGVTAIDGFEINRYMGTWYEIARLDHRFEKGLDNISATYTLREDGGVNVVNKGWNQENNEWKQAEGKAYFVEQPDKAALCRTSRPADCVPPRSRRSLV